jgi:putative resolvase
MKLHDWARKQGISYMTAWRWFRDGRLPVEAERMPSGTIIVKDSGGGTATGVALYARVSSSDRKTDLDGQVARLIKHAQKQGWAVSQSVTEIGSGLNGHRPKLMKLLADRSIQIIIVEHRDRLMRFGSEYVESALKAQNRRLVVVDPSEMKDDLVQDMTQVLTSFFARLYGRRSAANKARKAIEAMEHGK